MTFVNHVQPSQPRKFVYYADPSGVQTQRFYCVIEHNLGSEEIVVQCYTKDNKLFIPQQVTILDQNSVCITVNKHIKAKYIIYA